MGCLIYMPLILPLDAHREREEKKKSVSPCGPFVGPKMNALKLLSLWRSEDVLLFARNVQQLHPRPDLLQELM